MFSMLIDTHAHLYLPEFDNDREAMIGRAMAAGVGRFYLPNIDSSSIGAMLRLEQQYPGQCFAMMGLHPCSVKEDYRKELAIVEDWLVKRPFAAVGEIGIDLYWDKTFVKEQDGAFLQQIEWAAARQLPVVIHSRDAMDHILQLLRHQPIHGLRGVFHCFSGTVSQAEVAIELGFLLGIGGVLTFKNSGLDLVVKSLPLEHLVLETDSPYLAPVPYRGKRNESSYLALVANRLADIKGLPVDEVASITTQNAMRLFARHFTTA
jgi:TatD DNase family protein